MKRARNEDEQALRERLEAFRKSKQTRQPAPDPPKVSSQPSSIIQSASNNALPKKISAPTTTPASKPKESVFTADHKIKFLQLLSAQKTLEILIEEYQKLLFKLIAALENGEAVEEVEKEKSLVVKRFDDIVNVVKGSLWGTTFVPTRPELFETVLRVLQRPRRSVKIEDTADLLRDIDRIVSVVDETGRARLECQQETADLAAKIEQERDRLAVLKKENENLAANHRMASMLLTVQTVKTVNESREE